MIGNKWYHEFIYDQLSYFHRDYCNKEDPSENESEESRHELPRNVTKLLEPVLSVPHPRKRLSPNTYFCIANWYWIHIAYLNWSKRFFGWLYLYEVVKFVHNVSLRSCCELLQAVRPNITSLVPLILLEQVNCHRTTHCNYISCIHFAEHIELAQ